jgi:hypothetical protein
VTDVTWKTLQLQPRQTPIKLLAICQQALEAETAALVLGNKPLAEQHRERFMAAYTEYRQLTGAW